jgi:hypothetical protein
MDEVEGLASRTIPCPATRRLSLRCQRLVVRSRNIMTERLHKARSPDLFHRGIRTKPMATPRYEPICRTSSSRSVPTSPEFKRDRPRCRFTRQAVHANAATKWSRISSKEWYENSHSEERESKHTKRSTGEAIYTHEIIFKRKLLPTPVGGSSDRNRSSVHIKRRQVDNTRRRSLTQLSGKCCTVEVRIFD